MSAIRPDWLPVVSARIRQTPLSTSMMCSRASLSREFSGHSLRSGYATQAAREGHHPTRIAATTRHQDQRVLAGYIRAGRGRADLAHVL